MRSSRRQTREVTSRSSSANAFSLPFTAAFVLGLLAALFAMIPLIGVIAWPPSILGLVFGLVGIARARNGVATNKGLSIAGTVLAAIGPGAVYRMGRSFQQRRSGRLVERIPVAVTLGISSMHGL